MLLRKIRKSRFVFLTIFIAVMILINIFLMIERGADKQHFMNSRVLTQPMKNPFTGVTMLPDNHYLLKIIRNEHLVPPSTEPYENIGLNLEPSPECILEVLQNKTNGFFVEFDGYIQSNSYYMEKVLGWNGLLIESDAKNYEKIIKQNRKVWKTNSCVSPYKYPVELTFYNFTGSEGVAKQDNITNLNETLSSKVQCFPIYSFLMALNRIEVDYFSLDVEGSELDILQSIPWNILQIKTFSIEILWPNKMRRKVIKTYMEGQGYIFFKNIQDHDYLFYHPKYFDEEIIKRFPKVSE